MMPCKKRFADGISKQFLVNSREENSSISKKICTSTLITDTFLKLDCTFYERPCVELAKSLLGQILVRKLESGTVLKGRIVETECYLGADDKASHSYQSRKTERNSPMFMKPGTSYVYFIYGMYCCFNISSQGEGAAVLVRALEPIVGSDTMRQLRGANLKNGAAKLKPHQLCNGPSKLCMALGISKQACNQLDLSSSLDLWLESGDSVPQSSIVITTRIGIDSCGEEWAGKLLRFYVRGNSSVSIKDKKAEQAMDGEIAG